MYTIYMQYDPKYSSSTTEIHVRVQSCYTHTHTTTPHTLILALSAWFGSAPPSSANLTTPTFPALHASMNDWRENTVIYIKCKDWPIYVFAMHNNTTHPCMHSLTILGFLIHNFLIDLLTSFATGLCSD